MLRVPNLFYAQIVIPSGIPNGGYIMRHEIISLQNAVDHEAESYPSCSQLLVTDSTSPLTPEAFVQSLPANATIHFPGGYNKSDPGWNVDVYTNPEKLNYDTMIPGPSIPTALTNDGGAGGSKNISSSIATTMIQTLTSGAPETSITSTSMMLTSQHNSLTTSAPTSSIPNATTSVALSLPTTTSSGSPHVITTTITRVFVMTMTLPDTTNSSLIPPSNDIRFSIHSTNPPSPRISSAITATVPSEDPPTSAMPTVTTLSRLERTASSSVVPITTTSASVKKRVGSRRLVLRRRHHRR